MSNKTVILVTHQLQFIKMVDQVVIMDKGKITDVGAFDELDVNIIELSELTRNKILFHYHRNNVLEKMFENNSTDERESPRSARGRYLDEYAKYINCDA